MVLIACFADAFILHKSGNVEIMAKSHSFIFAFDAEVVAGHVHLCWVVGRFLCSETE
jgi:hypothetical protein